MPHTRLCGALPREGADTCLISESWASPDTNEVLSGCLWNSHASVQRRAGLHSERLGFHYGDAWPRTLPVVMYFPTVTLRNILRRSAGHSSPAANLLGRSPAAAPTLPDTAPRLLPGPPSAQSQTPTAPVSFIPLWQSSRDLCLPAEMSQVQRERSSPKAGGSPRSFLSFSWGKMKT